jgi:hypothetical protein
MATTLDEPKSQVISVTKDVLLAMHPLTSARRFIISFIIRRQ